MPTHAELAARLLTDTAVFFRNLAEQNEPVRKQMTDNAAVLDRMAAFLLSDPTAKALDGSTYARLGAKLLRDAAKFFKVLGEQNELLREQMEQNIDIFEKLAAALAADPNGVVE